MKFLFDTFRRSHASCTGYGSSDENVKMDIRNIFKAASDKLMAEFNQSAEVNHQGGKGTLREDAFSNFLSSNLPSRYAVGRGEVINSFNYTSGQLDLVIHDPFYCPAIVSSPSHSVFPIESVFGAISIKSTLTSEELKDAYKNIGSFHKIVLRNSFQGGGNGFVVGLNYPHPFTAIVAYKTDRSLETIAKQVEKLDQELSDVAFRPDLVCILGEGIIGPREPLRGDFNKFSLPSGAKALSALRKTGRHTLLKFYLQILREINQLKLRPLDLAHYENMPKLVGPYRVRRHDTFALIIKAGPESDQATRLTKFAIETIVKGSISLSLQEVFQAWLGQIPQGVNDLSSKVYYFNPNNLPAMSADQLQNLLKGKQSFGEVFNPHQLEIDGKEYFLDFSSLPDGSFEDNPDLTFEELMSL